MHIGELVSVVTPCFNSERYLHNTINSVLNQTYTNWELILVNDFSQDQSKEILTKYAKSDQRIKVINLGVNKGVANARNIGLSIAKGIYIAFLDSDDLWHPEKVEKQVKFMSENQADISFTAYRKINEEGGLISDQINVPRKVDYSELLLHNVIPCSSSMFRRYKLDGLKFIKIGHEDFVFWLNALKKVEYAYGLNETLMYYRIQANSISSNKFKAAGYTWCIYRKVERFGFFKAVYFFLNYAFHSFKKYLK